MEHAFWQHAWHNNLTGWHLDYPHPALVQHWPQKVSNPAPVLIPLCGKSLDIRWLAEQGHAVTGVELEPLAIADFFREQGLTPEEQREQNGQPAQSAGGITLVEGDFYEFTPATPFPLFYDRAALVALPPAMRQTYLAHLARCLAPGAEGLLVTFEYRSDVLEGPPFHVPESEVTGQPWFDVEFMERQRAEDAYPFLVKRGAEDLCEATYWLRKKA
ncbi:thiopurine S-methyltransferase [Marinobacteraceae bacterium S3BR75-40.1]